jgi:hypothetical protein
MSKGIEVQAPKPLVFKNDYITLFLGGSIEMGKAEDWQKKTNKIVKRRKNYIFQPKT